MENVKVSVIVPVYNVETYLEEALMSLKNQTLKEIEFLIINDGSTDNSQKIIEEIAQDDPRFRVFNVKNGGIGKAFNLGVSEAKGEYIAEFESDDYVALHAYERLYNTA
ncbi:glycosyltransferase family 2 protein, partial [Enterococcus faecalis]